MSRTFGAACAALLLVVASPSSAQVAAAGTTLVIPVVASTATFTTELMVQDMSGVSRTVNMTFHEAVTSSTPGPKTCTPIALSPYQPVTVTLSGNCPIAAGSHHGFVILSDASAPATNLMYAFARTVNFAGIGFAVDGIPIGHIGGGESYAEVIGLKKQAAAGGSPEYQSNCFVAALDDPVNYTIAVYTAGQTYTINDALQPFQMRRYLDIYASAGVPAGNRANTTVGFMKTGGTEPNTLLAFCTVQDNTSFGADFRIAKQRNGGDGTRIRNSCWATVWSANACTNTLEPWAPTIANGATKARWATFVYAPDTVVCSLKGPRAADLEMRLGRYVNGVFTILAGGNNQQSFVYTTGRRSALNNGWHSDHYLEVSFREGGNATFPIPYGVNCQSGNGTANFVWNGTPADDF